MKITVKQLKQMISEQIEEMGATAGFVEHSGEQLELPLPNSNSRTLALKELEDELKHFDWYYMMSDDNRVYQAGSRAMNALRQKAKSLGDDGVELFNKYSDEHTVNLKEEQSVPNAPPVPIHEQGACAVITSKDMRPGETSLEEETDRKAIRARDMEAWRKKESEKDLPLSLEWKKCSTCGRTHETNKPTDICRRCASGRPAANAESNLERLQRLDAERLAGLKKESAIGTSKDVCPGETSLEEETEEGCHECYTGSPADGGGITGTQTTSGAADVVKEVFNHNASKGLADLKKELDGDASKDLPPSKWKKCKVCEYSETNRPSGICRRCASNGNKIVGEQ